MKIIGFKIKNYLCKKIKMSDIIFLDIDGVLRTHKSDSEWSEKLNTPIFKRTDRLFSKKFS
jgi:hypothetical protein